MWIGVDFVSESASENLDNSCYSILVVDTQQRVLQIDFFFYLGDAYICDSDSMKIYILEPDHRKR